MLVKYKGLFVQGLFLTKLGFVNFVLNPSQVAFWQWYDHTRVKKRGNMLLIHNTLHYVTNLLMCLCNLG